MPGVVVVPSSLSPAGAYICTRCCFVLLILILLLLLLLCTSIPKGIPGIFGSERSKPPQNHVTHNIHRVYLYVSNMISYNIIAYYILLYLLSVALMRSAANCSCRRPPPAWSMPRRRKYEEGPSITAFAGNVLPAMLLRWLVRLGAGGAESSKD